LISVKIGKVPDRRRSMKRKGTVYRVEEVRKVPLKLGNMLSAHKVFFLLSSKISILIFCFTLF